MVCMEPYNAQDQTVYSSLLPIFLSQMRARAPLLCPSAPINAVRVARRVAALTPSHIQSLSSTSAIAQAASIPADISDSGVVNHLLFIRDI